MKREERLVFSFVCYFINGFGFEFILHEYLTVMCSLSKEKLLLAHKNDNIVFGTVVFEKKKKTKTIRFPLSTLFTLCILYVEEVSNSICLLLHVNKQ